MSENGPHEPVEKNLLLEHEYDGIQEYDNPTPGWWHAIFWGTVLFGVLYFVFFEFGPAFWENAPGWTVEESYEAAVVEDLKRRFGAIGDLEPDEPTILRFMNEDDWLKVGAVVYEGNCVSCHGVGGIGQIGPNLTDNHFKNVKKLADVARVINVGASNGAMPAWQHRLHPNEVVLTAAYVARMRGQNLPGPRGPEGEEIPPWPEPPEPEPEPTPSE